MKKLLVLALGSNLGNKRQNLNQCRQWLLDTIGPILAQSQEIETEPFGVSEPQPSYVNQVIVLATDHSLEQIFRKTQEIEKFLGRHSKGDLKARTIDIDLLYFGNSQISSSDLTIPHPRILERSFVFGPLVEVLPYFRILLS